MNESKRHDPPSMSPELGDAAHQIATAAISSVPLVGGPAAELVNTVLAPPLLKRQQRWREEIAAAIRDLEARFGLLPDELSSNDAFVNAVLRASDVATRTSDSLKIDALRRALINSALPEAPSQALQQIFMNLVDSMTVWHLKILDVFHSPRERIRRNPGSPRISRSSSSLERTLVEALPEMAGKREFYDHVWRDLYSWGLVTTDSLHSMITAEGALESRTSSLGKQLLAFISDSRDDLA
jgi:hypothetical protein